MVRNIVVPGILLIFASPVLAASGPFFSLRNTDFVVLISFILFGLVLIYLKVPSMLGKMLDQRAASIKTELDEARALREESGKALGSYVAMGRYLKDGVKYAGIALKKEDGILTSRNKLDTPRKSIQRRTVEKSTSLS